MPVSLLVAIELKRLVEEYAVLQMTHVHSPAKARGNCPGKEINLKVQVLYHVVVGFFGDRTRKPIRMQRTNQVRKW